MLRLTILINNYYTSLINNIYKLINNLFVFSPLFVEHVLQVKTRDPSPGSRLHRFLYGGPADASQRVGRDHAPHSQGAGAPVRIQVTVLIPHLHFVLRLQAGAGGLSAQRHDHAGGGREAELGTYRLTVRVHGCGGVRAALQGGEARQLQEAG